MVYCTTCVLPDTRPNLTLGQDGVCIACRTHGRKSEIDWDSRARAFDRLVVEVKAASHGYDCVIPVSGGKDSTWQVIRCLEAGLTPLAVTWKTPARTLIGQQNLDNLVALGVDHIDYQINPKVEGRFMLRALERFGSTAIPMHLALFNIPLRVAVKFGIRLIVWGENSAFEYGSASHAHTGVKLDDEWYRTYGVTHGTTAADWVGEDFTEKELAGYVGPNPDELERSGTHAVFLGWYFPWDPQKSLAVARAHGFQSRSSGARTGYYDFADIDDDFISIHHWLKWYKFGFTRLFDNLSLEIRNGRLTREQAVAIIRERGDQTPHEDIAKFCRFVGIEQAQFWKICETFRNRAIWTRGESGTWRIPNFLIQDWTWT
ncbi:MAG: N-acetyl sugar amidotransferase [Nitrospira sp.]|jgi:N-acetyl sugar amidotransferase|nr:N-acetyl sugar amidotransferase [Nitrospira sp.]HRA95491.1 N-acetyl sugar amidotransferase [Nitrospira sp.]